MVAGTVSVAVRLLSIPGVFQPISDSRWLAECIGRCGVSIRDVSVGAAAAAHAVLSDDEKELGAAVVDIGAGTMALSVFERGVLCHTAVLAAASQGEQFGRNLLSLPSVERAGARRQFLCCWRLPVSQRIHDRLCLGRRAFMSGPE